MAKIWYQILGVTVILAGGAVGVFLKQPAIGGIITAIGFWIGSMGVTKK